MSIVRGESEVPTIELYKIKVLLMNLLLDLSLNTIYSQSRQNWFYHAC